MSTSIFSISDNTRNSSNQKLSLEPHDILANRYRLISKIGAGGFGEVWKAMDQFLKQKVALKITWYGRKKEALDRIINEVRFLRRLSRDRFVNIYDYFRDEENQCHGYSMELLEQEKWRSVGNYINKGTIEGINGPYTTVRIFFELFKDLAYSLDLLHSDEVTETNKNYSLIHGDIKPDNMYTNLSGVKSLVCGFGKKYSMAKIGDFGLSNTSGNNLYGFTQNYSPEVDKSLGTLTPQFDIYSLGQSMLYNICGECLPPKQGISKQIEAKISKFAKNAKFTNALKLIVSGMVKKQPSNRDEMHEIFSNFDLLGILNELDWQIIRYFEESGNHPTKFDALSRWLLNNYYNPVFDRSRLNDKLKSEMKDSINKLKRYHLIKNSSTSKQVYELINP